VADVPHVKLYGEVDPSDIGQGGVGDCWLLSAISAMAEFEGIIQHLFRKTEVAETLPRDDPNVYTVTLWDMSRWEETDIVIDERLVLKPNGQGLLGCRPSVDGELWACYLEKAVAAHCGGWDQIEGGTCVHAWRLLLGIRDTYTFKADSDGNWTCWGLWNPNTESYEEITNSPREGYQGVWPMNWPEVGGARLTLDDSASSSEMFKRLAAWDEEDYLMCCGTEGSDDQATDGIVDGHAYTIMEAHENILGTGINLIKVRNPWGKGEFACGRFDDDGPGWSEYPQIKDFCNHAKADDGIFWLEDTEFFTYFKQIYLGAQNMGRFI